MPQWKGNSSTVQRAYVKNNSMKDSEYEVEEGKMERNRLPTSNTDLFGTMGCHSQAGGKQIINLINLL